MENIITHKTAFMLYRYLRNKQSAHKENFRHVKDLKIPLAYKSKDENIIRQFLISKVNEDNINLLNSSFIHARSSNNIKTFSSKLNYPKNSFIELEEKIYIPCPELLFYQLSQILNFSHLMLAGLELCGNYSLVDNIESCNPYEIQPVLNKESLLKYLNNLQTINSHAQSIRKANCAAKYLEENSFSPLESRLYIMLCSPRYLGGFGITNMKFNKKVSLSNKATKILGHKCVYPDLCNKNLKIAIEYDSEKFHDNTAQNIKDKLRINALQSDGWRVFSFVKTNTYNVDSMQWMALDILKANGQDKRIRQKNFKEKRDILHSQLFFL